MANSADPDQLASSEANWSGSTLFAKAGHIRVQQDKGLEFFGMSDISSYCTEFLIKEVLIRQEFLIREFLLRS